MDEAKKQVGSPKGPKAQIDTSGQQRAKEISDELSHSRPGKEPFNFCPSCGQKAPVGVPFCSNCGHSLRGQSPQDQVQGQIRSTGGGTSLWHNRAVLVILAIAGFIVIITIPIVITQHKSTQKTATVSVAGDRPWTDTGIDVAKDSSITITTSGKIKIAGSDPGKTPDGDQGCRGDKKSIAPGLTCNSLVGRIGEGAPFEVDTNKTLSGTPAGHLYLGVNDTFFDDNSGNWTADINVSY